MKNQTCTRQTCSKLKKNRKHPTRKFKAGMWWRRKQSASIRTPSSQIKPKWSWWSWRRKPSPIKTKRSSPIRSSPTRSSPIKPKRSWWSWWPWRRKYDDEIKKKEKTNDNDDKFFDDEIWYVEHVDKKIIDWYNKNETNDKETNFVDSKKLAIELIHIIFPPSDNELETYFFKYHLNGSDPKYHDNLIFFKEKWKNFKDFFEQHMIIFITYLLMKQLKNGKILCTIDQVKNMNKSICAKYRFLDGAIPTFLNYYKKFIENATDPDTPSPSKMINMSSINLSKLVVEGYIPTEKEHFRVDGNNTATNVDTRIYSKCYFDLTTGKEATPENIELYKQEQEIKEQKNKEMNKLKLKDYAEGVCRGTI